MRRDAWPSLSVPLDTRPMEARTAERLPQGQGWQFEPKWDGFRCLAFRAGGAVELKGKSGKSLSRYFPEIVELLRSLETSPFVLDGELVVPLDGDPSFVALQARLHPAASRIARLASETPARFIVFDCLMDERNASLLQTPLHERRAALEALFRSWSARTSLQLTPFTRQRRQALRWMEHSRGVLDASLPRWSMATTSPERGPW